MPGVIFLIWLMILLYYLEGQPPVQHLLPVLP
jgi:hypothetical protein